MSRRAVVRWAAVACVCSAPAQAQLRPTVRMERADGTAGARNTIRLQLPLAWQISTPWSLRYLLAAEVGERLRSAPALDQSVRLTRNPASARRGWQLTSMLRAGRISALDLAADLVAAATADNSRWDDLSKAQFLHKLAKEQRRAGDEKAADANATRAAAIRPQPK